MAPLKPTLRLLPPPPQIWKLLQDVDAVGWVQRISPHMQAAEGAMRVVNVAAKPFQGIFRGIRLPLKPFPLPRAYSGGAARFANCESQTASRRLADPAWATVSAAESGDPVG